MLHMKDARKGIHILRLTACHQVLLSERMTKYSFKDSFAARISKAVFHCVIRSLLNLVTASDRFFKMLCPV